MTQQKLVDVLTSLNNAKLGAFQLAVAREKEILTPQMISFSKRYNVGEALKSARICREVLGANGISLEYRSMRHSCNLETVNTYEGTYDVHTLVLGQSITGHAAFKR